MTNEAILSDEQIVMTMNVPQEDYTKEGWVTRQRIRMGRAIEQAMLESPEIQALKRDKERLDWLADPKNNIGNVQLPKACVERNPHSLRDAIDDAMEYKNESNN